MSHTPHELHEEFPNQAERIHALKADNAHFSKLADDYHDLNRAIHRAEADVEPTDDAHLTEMRKQRLLMLDQIKSML